MKIGFFRRIGELSMRAKRIIALSVCVALLAIAIIQNVRTNEGASRGKDNVGDGVIVDNNQPSEETGVMYVEDTKEYFAGRRLEKLTQRSQAEEACLAVINDKQSSSQSIEEANVQYEVLNILEAKESEIETGIKARGYEDVFVIMDENGFIDITVKTSNLDENEAASIAAIVTEKSEINMENFILRGVSDDKNT